MKKFVKGRLYCGTLDNTDFILKYVSVKKNGVHLFENVNCDLGFYEDENGLIPFAGATPDFRRAYHWSDLPTAKDREKARLKTDPLNGKFEEDFLRHYAAKRARLRNLTPVMGGEYYAKP